MPGMTSLPRASTTRLATPRLITGSSRAIRPSAIPTSITVSTPCPGSSTRPPRTTTSRRSSDWSCGGLIVDSSALEIDTLRAGSHGRLVKRAVLHDHAERGPVLEDLDVRERIAVHEQEVGEGARLHHAQLARPPHELAAELGRGHEGLHGRKAEDLDEDPEVPRVRAVRCEHEAVVASGKDPDAALAHARDRLDGDLQLALEGARPLGRDAPLSHRLRQVVG